MSSIFVKQIKPGFNMVSKLASLIVSLFWHNIVNAQKTITFDDICHLTLSEIKYDTVEGLFFYENRIQAYIDADAIVKPGGYVRVMDDLNKSYFDSYYFLNSACVQSLKSDGNNIRFDSVSIRSFESEQYYESVVNGGLWGVTNLNPYCGIYYKKYFFKMVVLKIGAVKQRLPFFEDCDQLKKRKNKNYRIGDLPTYLITDIFEYKKVE